MDLPGTRPAATSNRVRHVSAALRLGACTIVDWALSAAAEDDAEGGESEHGPAEASGSDGSDDEGGYASNAASLPPAIANDPFFARLLRNAEMHEASEKKKQAKKRRAKEAVDDVYDLEDPFIDDSELTVMDSHSYAKAQQRKKRRKKDDGNGTETEGQGPAAASSAAAEVGGAAAVAHAAGSELGSSSLDDLDRYEEDEFFVYFGPLNETEEASSAADAFELPAKGARPRSRPARKQQPAKAPTQGKKRANGAAGAKGDGSDVAAKRKHDPKVPHQRDSNGTAVAGQIPSNGRKAGARTSRKLGLGKQASRLDGMATDATDSTKHRLPPIPDRDRPPPSDNKTDGDAAPPNAPDAAASSAAAAASAAAPSGKGGGAGSKPHHRRAGTPAAGAAVSSIAVAPDDTKALAQARLPTPEIEAALLELDRAAQSEAFTNRQRFPSSLKPFLRQVCELSMAHALEYDREVMALDIPEHRVFAWSTPLDIVGFTTDIYYRLSDILPYNRATVRKIVSKLLGQDLLTWKERQLKQIEEGLKARVDGQIEQSMGWIPVGARPGMKEADDPSSGGSQVRWHWTTLSKHMLYQYMVLSLNINEMRNHLGHATGKDGVCREQQARKDAYARLVNLWPGSSMSTYEISRAYSSRKSLLEKQNKKSDGVPAASQIDSEVLPPSEAAPEPPSSPPPRKTPEPPGVAAATAAAAADPRPASDCSPDQPLVQMFYDSLPRVAEHPASPYVHIERMASSPRSDFAHRSPGFSGFGRSPGQHFEVPHHQATTSQPTAYHNGAGGPFAPPAASHRSLEFGAAGPPPQADSLMRSHDVHYYHNSNRPALPPQQHQHPQHHDPHNAASSAGDDGHNSPGSGRYSMSVRNLTTP
ncbi:hypothetical protein LPJ61_000029 [Coemansia biformis]|uniref:Ubinuclein middle domain-containing protein n=1 Tax=Coemansia biformis TaxID=1286918 RepID=A0A9W7YJ14_9FUNG|nr:hypothetical protein LPJ61_000029 [Coemansia biformis]